MSEDEDTIFNVTDPPKTIMDSGKQQGFQIRLPPDMIRQIDELVEQKKFTTRNEFIKRAAIHMLDYEEFRRTQRSELLTLIKHDHEMRREIIDSLKKIALEELQK
jgi:Arc/MetJ-type ribon-helix-helix transcriptional regulator